MTEVLTTIDECTAWSADVERSGARLALVPTMGALHEGHLALVRTAAADNDRVIVSIFVNPLQFDATTDLARYPRSLERDVELAGATGASAVFAPSRAAMFPAGEPIVTVDPGALGELFEGASRPGHFRGVATIVSRLFHLTRAPRAYFGEKDYEQLVVIRRMVADLSIPVAIDAVPTVRDADGLALSSRNRLLTDADRKVAPVLYRALCAGADYVGAGGRSAAALEAVMAEHARTEPRVQLDYAVARAAGDLARRDLLAGSLRLLIAATLGGIRLIDNVGVDT